MRSLGDQFRLVSFAIKLDSFESGQPYQETLNPNPDVAEVQEDLKNAQLGNYHISLPDLELHIPSTVGFICILLKRYT